MQAELTRFGGYGNSKATIGRGGWLFYAPGITALGGPPFLDPDVLAARARSAGDAPVSPDPRPAVLDFARFLGARGHPPGAVPGARQGRPSAGRAARPRP